MVAVTLNCIVSAVLFSLAVKLLESDKKIKRDNSVYKSISQSMINV